MTFCALPGAVFHIALNYNETFVIDEVESSVEETEVAQARPRETHSPVNHPSVTAGGTKESPAVRALTDE